MTVTDGKRTSRKTTSGENSTLLSYIHFADGNKGGVGKSFVARTLYQWFIDHQVPVIGFDTDPEDNPDFSDIYPDIARTVFSETQSQEDAANVIVNQAAMTHQPVVVNLPARAHHPFQAWLAKFDILTLAAEQRIGLVKWFVTTGEADSLRSLVNSLRACGTAVPHIVVRNRKYDDWSFYNEADEVLALIQATHSQVIDLPRLPARLASTILNQRLTYDQARTYQGKSYGITEQAGVRKFLAQAYGEFERTGVLPS
ncbi:MAG: hypothetical protein AAF329_06460 [Cyanobacteria bacterium P01_A01_bin.17]